MPSVDSTPELIVEDGAAWQRWLDEHHTTSAGVVLVLAKKGVTEPTSLGRDEALELALAYGWIDGRTGKRDDSTWTVRFTRRPYHRRDAGATRLI